MEVEAYSDHGGAPVSTDRKFERLLHGHIVAALLHVVQAAVLAAIADSSSSVGVYWVRYSVWKPTEGVSAARVFGLAIEYIPPAFLFAAAVDHAICAWQWIYSDYKLKTMEGRASNCWREYAVSASAMNVMIIVLCGNADLWVHLFVFVCTALCMFSGMSAETAYWKGQRELAETLFDQGCLAFVAVWTVIFAHFFDQVRDAPAFVWAIVIVLFLLECGFAVNMQVYFNRNQTPESIYSYEWTKIVLSITAKAALAWIQYAGARASSRAMA